MTTIGEMEETARHAIGQLGAEIKYLEELKADILKEDYDQVCYIVKKTKNEYITTEEAIKLCLQYV